MSASAKTNILLAIDFAPGEPLRHISAAVDLAKEFVRDRADHVVVLHVREFSVSRLPLMMREHGGADGRRAVDEVVFGLRATGVSASGLVREADVTHVSRAILDAAAEFDARLIVVNSPRHRLPVGGVAAGLVHHAEVPVVVAAKPCLAAAVQLPAR